MTLQTLWSRLSGHWLRPYGSAYQVPIIDGQSLALGYNASPEQRSSLNYRNRNGVVFLDGLFRSDSTPELPVPIRLNGPMTLSYATDHATGLIPAASTGFTASSFTFALALDLWRRDLKSEINKQVASFNGVPGQSIVEFNNDPNDGQLGDLIRSNHRRWYSELLSVMPDSVPLVYGCLQGEADVGQTEQWYLSKAMTAYEDALLDIELAFGIRPPVIIWQTGSYTNTVGDEDGPILAQLKLVDEYSAIFAGPLYPNLTFDNVVHPTLEYQILHCEIAAMVWARREAGDNINLLPGNPEWDGNTVTIPFSVQAGHELVFESGDKYDDYGGLINHGVEVQGANIVSVTLSGGNVIVECDAPATMVQIALQSQDVSSFVDGNGNNYGAHRCDIMESDPENSLMLDGFQLKRFIPSCRFLRP